MNKILKAVQDLSRAFEEQRLRPPAFISLSSQDELLHISNFFERECGYMYPSERFMDLMNQGGKDYIAIQINGIEFRAPARGDLIHEVLRLRFRTQTAAVGKGV